MKIYRFSMLIILITFIALLYVNQQVQLVRISYKINSSEKNLTSLLDRNRALVYNVIKMKSPVNLERRFLASRKDYRISQQSQVVTINVPKEAPQSRVVAAAKKETFGIYKIFGRPKEAYAKTIK